MAPLAETAFPALMDTGPSLRYTQFPFGMMGLPRQHAVRVEMMKMHRIHDLSQEATAALIGVGLMFAVTSRADDAKVGDVFQKVKDAVVVVRTQSTSLAPTPEQQLTSRDELGSGFIISEEGEVITAAHLVQTADSVEVDLPNGKSHSARVVSSVPLADVALLQLEGVIEKLPWVELGNSAEAAIGDQVLVVGAPYGATHTLTVGHLSARRNPPNALAQLEQVEFLQTDAAINTGNSGGPMFNMQGQVVGMVSHIISKSGGWEGLGFAVTSATIQDVLLDSSPFWSGLEATMLQPALARALNLPQDCAYLVQNVAKNSPAARLGLRAGSLRAVIEGESVLLGGDVIIAIQGVKVEGLGSLEAIDKRISKLRGGDTIVVTVFRNGTAVDLETPHLKSL